MSVHPIPNDDQLDSWQPLNLTTLPDQPPVEPTLGSVGLVYPGRRHVFSGPPESAKTLAAYAIAIQTVRDTPDATVLLLDFEMGAYETRQRLLELGATTDEIARFLYVEPDEPATQPRIDTLVQLQPTLVLIDAAAGAYALQGLDDEKRLQVELFTQLYVRGFWRAGIATIIIDHVTKNSEARGRYAIGSERKLGGADVHLGFDIISPISRGTTGRYKISTHKDRGGYLKRGHVADLTLTSDPDTHQISWEITPAEAVTPDSPFRPTILMERISAFLSLQHEPVSRKQIEQGVKGTNAQAKRQAMDILVLEGFAAEQPGPRGARNLVHIHLYRQDDPACNPEDETSLDLVGRTPDQVGRSTSSTSSDLVPTSSDEVSPTSSDLVPPYRGTTARLDEDNHPTSSHQTRTLDDDIPW